MQENQEIQQRLKKQRGDQADQRKDREPWKQTLEVGGPTKTWRTTTTSALTGNFHFHRNKNSSDGRKKLFLHIQDEEEEEEEERKRKRRRLHVVMKKGGLSDVSYTYQTVSSLFLMLLYCVCSEHYKRYD